MVKNSADMVTMVQIKDETMHRLKQIKKERGLITYDDVVQFLIKNEVKSKLQSMCGFLGKATREEILKDLRDKHDRF